MQTFLTTPRLCLRELLPSDDAGMFELDSDPEVHRYLGRTPVQSIDQSREVIAMIRRKYETDGIGRWAVVRREDDAFLGWAGLSLVKEELVNGRTGFYDLGYRLIRRYWGQGYGFEAARACLDYGFTQMNLPEIFAYVDTPNLASRRILEKLGFRHTATFDLDGDESCWYELRQVE